MVECSENNINFPDQLQYQAISSLLYFVSRWIYIQLLYFFESRKAVMVGCSEKLADQLQHKLLVHCCTLLASGYTITLIFLACVLKSNNGRV